MYAKSLEEAKEGEVWYGISMRGLQKYTEVFERGSLGIRNQGNFQQVIKVGIWKV